MRTTMLILVVLASLCGAAPAASADTAVTNGAVLYPSTSQDCVVVDPGRVPPVALEPC